ncbi:MAG: hypothetical protein IJA85_00285 [Clostridia bacterium]|nr:hypothetical protein [Clostridia bacterium]
MKNSFNRIAALMLAVLMILMTVVSCSEPVEDEGSAVTTAAAAAESEAVETELTRANYPDTLDPTLKFDGDSYRVLCRSDDYFEGGEIVVEKQTGDVVNDAIYEKNMSVAERLGVSIESVLVEKADYNNTVKKNIQADLSVYDIAAAYAYYITPLALEGYFIDLQDLPHIDFEMPWWPDSIMDKLVINDVLYFMSGDYSLSLISEIFCIYFNKSVAEEYQIPDLYEMVFNGTWTLENYINIASSVTQDLDGNSTYDVNDMYGVATLSFNAFLTSTEIDLTEFDDEGNLVLTIYNDKFVDVYKRVYDFMHNSPAAFSMKTLLADRQQEVTVFVNDRCLFYPERFLSTSIFRDMESDFGFVPYPKYDETQEKYHTISHDNYSLLCVPITTQDLEMVGAVTEAMAAESYRTVTPAYLDIALKEKYSRDEGSKKMCDLLIEGTVFEPLLIYSNSLADAGLLMYNIFQDREDITSLIEKQTKVYQKAFDKFNEKYAAAR